MTGRFGFNHGTSGTSPYVSAPKRPGAYSGGDTTSAVAPRGLPERFPTEPDALSKVAEFGMRQPAVVAERPLGLVNQIGKFLLGSSGKKEFDASGAESPSGPVSAALGAIGHISFGAPGRKSGGLSIGDIVGVAEGALREEGTWSGALMNSEDASIIKYIEERHLSSDAVIPFSGSNPVFGVLNALGGPFAGARMALDWLNPEKTTTVREYYASLEKRQFFTDPKTGQQLTPADLVRQINEAGPLGAFQFGDRNVTDDPTLNAALKMATDPMNIAFMAGGPAFIAARYGAFAGKINAATKVMGEWALPSVWKAAGAGKVAHGVGEFEDVGRLIGRLPGVTKLPSASVSAEAIVAGDVSKATAKGLAVLLRRGMKEVFLPGSDGLVTRYYRGALRQQVGELAIEHLPGIGDQYDEQGNQISSGWFSAAHDAAEAILDDHQLSGNQLFVLMTAFTVPARKLAGEYPAGVRVASEKAFGSRRDALWAKDGGFSDSLGQGKNAVEAMDNAWGEGDAAAGRARRDRLTDQLNLKIAFDRVMRNPVWKVIAKSMDQSAFTVGMFEKILRQHSNFLVATGKISEKMRLSTFKEWGTDHLTSYIDPVTGDIAHLTFPAGFSLSKQGLIDQWIRYDKANTGLVETVGPLQGAVLGRAPVLSKEGALAIESIVKDVMDENGHVSPLATEMIRDTLAQFPASFLEPIPANTREFLATLMNEGVAAKGYDGELIIKHLQEMSKRLPTADDLFHEANAIEAKSPVDVYSGTGGPLQDNGVSRFVTPAQFKEHQLNSISEARQIKADLADARQFYKDRWTKRGNYKGDPQDVVPLTQGFMRADAETFEMVRGQSSRPQYMTTHTPEELASSRMYLANDGLSGFMLTAEGDLQNLFSIAPKGSGAGERALETAIASGAKTLDAFDGYLTKLYKEHGFVEVSRVKFDPKYAPEGWNYAKDGRPDVVYMERPAAAPAAGESVTIRLTKDQIGEMHAFEVDTLDAGSPTGKAEFAALVQGMNQKGGSITLTGAALDYARKSTGPFANAADILRDQGRHSMAAAFERHHAGLGEPAPAPEAVAPDMTQTNLDTLRANDQAHIDQLNARLLELRKDQVDIAAAGEREGVIKLDWTFHNRDGTLSVAPESLDLLSAQTKYIQDFWPETFQVKKAPAVHVPWSMVDGAIGAVHQQRTNLGRIVFDYGPLAQMTKFIDYMFEPVSASGRARDTKLMVYKMLGYHGAAEHEITKYIATIDKARGDAPTIGPMQISTGGRGLNGFMPSQLNRMAHDIWGPQYSADGKLMSKGNPQFVENVIKNEGTSHGIPNYYKILDRASNSLVRKGVQAMLEGNYGLGGKQLLSRMFAKGYGMWQDAPFSGPTRMVSQLYPMFRFYLSARWQGMNRAENFLLGMFQDGLRAMRKPVREDLQSRQMYALAKGRVPGGRTDQAFMRPQQPSIIPAADSNLAAGVASKINSAVVSPEFNANLPDTGVYTGRFMEPAMRRQFQEAVDEKAFFKAIDELPANAPEIKWFVDMFGPNKRTWSKKANDMIYASEEVALSQGVSDMLTSWDTKGIHATMQGEAKAVAALDQWTPAQIAEIAPFLLRLEEKHAQLYKDIADIQMGNTDRSRMERLLNSYWLFWPISYQIKTTRWMVDLLSNKAFGHQTNLGGAYILSHGRQMIQEQMDSNPEFADQMANNGTLWMMANMIFPAVPWDQAVSLSRIPRYVGANVMHWFPTYAGLDNPFDYATKAMQLGPYYDSTLGSELLDEKGSFIQNLGAGDSDQEVVQPYRQ